MHGFVCPSAGQLLSQTGLIFAYVLTDWLKPERKLTFAVGKQLLVVFHTQRWLVPLVLMYRSELL